MRITRRKLVPATAGTAVAAANRRLPCPGHRSSSGADVQLSKSLDTLYGGVQTVCRIVGEMTDGNFVMEPFAAGEIIPALQVFDAVQNGTVELGYTYMGYYIGKHPAFIFDASLPFGMTPRMQNAWMYYGDNDLKLMDEIYDGYGLVTAVGQYRRPDVRLVPQGLEDTGRLPGRCARRGFTARSWPSSAPCRSRSPAATSIPQQTRTIDACEWVGPYDDEKLGFGKVAPYYYTPGVMELEALNVVLVSRKNWEALPKRYQAALKYASVYAMQDMMASYDAKNAVAISRLVASGTKLSVLPSIKALHWALSRCWTRRRPATRSSRRSSTTGASSGPFSTAGSRSPTRGPRTRSTARIHAS